MDAGQAGTPHTPTPKIAKSRRKSHYRQASEIEPPSKAGFRDFLQKPPSSKRTPPQIATTSKIAAHRV